MKTHLWTTALLVGALAVVLLQTNAARAESDEANTETSQTEMVRAVQIRYATLLAGGVAVLVALAVALSKFNQNLKKDHETRRKQAMNAPDDDYSVEGLSTGALWAGRPPDTGPSADKTPPQ
jgi:fucose permease